MSVADGKQHQPQVSEQSEQPRIQDAVNIESLLRDAGVTANTLERSESVPGQGPAGEGAPVLVSYCTDIEGNYDYWQRYLSLSKVIVRIDENGCEMDIPHTWTGVEASSSMSIVSNSTLNSINIQKAYGGRYRDPIYPAYARLALRPNCHFVFGGDACDRGPGDIRVLWDMLQLYEDHPGRVHFILGNRDVNKLRIPVELHDAYTRNPGSTYWVPRDAEQKPESAAERLKWMLSRTMGAPDGFEHRRLELKQIFCEQRKEYFKNRLEGIKNGTAPHLTPQEESECATFHGTDRYATEKVKVSDDEVMQSYLDLLFPPGINFKQGGKTRSELNARGLLLKYIMYGRIVMRMDDNLFVHGGINEHNIGWLAPLSPHREYSDEISATGALVKVGSGALGGDLIDILGTPRMTSHALKQKQSNESKIEEEESKGMEISPYAQKSIDRRAVFDAWCSEVNYRATLELRDFVENTRNFLLNLNARKPLNDANTAVTWGANDYHENYTENADAKTTMAHWSVTGTYTHPQPGSRLAYQGMAVCPDKTRNPSIIYSSYQQSGMPVNIVKYKGTITDESGVVQADATNADGSNHISAFLNAKKGSLIRSRRASPSLPLASPKSLGAISVEENDDGEDSEGSSESDENSTVDNSKTVVSISSMNAATLPQNTSASASVFMTPQLANVMVEDLGIQRIFCGHQPHGDAPISFYIGCDDSGSDTYGATGGNDTVAQQKHKTSKKQLQIIVGDTSYSSNTQWNMNPTLKPKTGDRIVWENDWKPFELTALKEQNEKRAKPEDTDIDDRYLDESTMSMLSAAVADSKNEEKVDSNRQMKRIGSDSKSSTAFIGSNAETKAQDKLSDSNNVGDKKAEGNLSRNASSTSNSFVRGDTPQMTQDKEDIETFNARPLDLWNLDAIQDGKLNSRGISVCEILIYIPQFTGVADNESIAEAKTRTEQYQNDNNGEDFPQPSRTFQHGILSDGSSYAFEQPSPNPPPNSNSSKGDKTYPSPPTDRYLGRATRNGKWVVKATNVRVKSGVDLTFKRHLPHNAGGDTSGARLLIPGHSTAQERVYLLSQGEGFIFKNRLVAARDMEAVMNE